MARSQASIEQQRRRNRRVYMRDYYRRWRLAALERVGGTKCTQCGFDDVRALQIDHVNGGGTKEADEHPGRETYYRRLAKAPDEEIVGVYQVLCANCNFIKMVENREIGGSPRKV